MIDPTDPFPNRPAGFARLPRLIRLYIFNAACGFLLSAVFTALVLVTNTGGLGQLVSQVRGGWLGALMFFVSNGIVFAGVQTAIVVMTMDDGPE